MVSNTIPAALEPGVEIALLWFNSHESAEFEVTGIVGPPESADEGGDLQLILCGAGLCRQETFRVVSLPEGPRVDWISGERSAGGESVAELDPPPGALRNWIDEVSSRHSFTVFLFYRARVAHALYLPVAIRGLREVYTTFENEQIQGA
ncbi:MAG: hypothetical protein OSB70_08975 [Myxococcota bacterium]|nr:hypothetical protein [Myxococcota bacterium]